MALQALTTARTSIESARGTVTTPTRLCYFEPGGAAWTQTVGDIAPLENWNSYFEQRRIYPGIERNSIAFTGDVDYDQMALWLAVYFKGGLTGTGAGADKIWAGTPSSSTDDLKSLTVQYGSSDAASIFMWQLSYCMGQTFELFFKKDQQLRFTATLMSAKAATSLGAFTGALSDRTVVTSLGTTTNITIDTSTIGTTADTNVLDASWKLDIRPEYLDVLDATNVAKDILRPNTRDHKLTITRYFANLTEWTAFTAKTERKVRIKSTGPALGGTTYLLTLDLYGYWTSRAPQVVNNGIIVDQLVLENLYDSTATTDVTLSITNSLAAIT